MLLLPPLLALLSFREVHPPSSLSLSLPFSSSLSQPYLLFEGGNNNSCFLIDLCGRGTTT